MTTCMLMITMVRFMDNGYDDEEDGDVYGVDYKDGDVYEDEDVNEDDDNCEVYYDDDKNDDTYQDWRESPP